MPCKRKIIQLLNTAALSFASTYVAANSICDNRAFSSQWDCDSYSLPTAYVNAYRNSNPAFNFTPYNPTPGIAIGAPTAPSGPIVPSPSASKPSKPSKKQQCHDTAETTFQVCKLRASQERSTYVAKQCAAPAFLANNILAQCHEVAYTRYQESIEVCTLNDLSYRIKNGCRK